MRAVSLSLSPPPSIHPSLSLSVGVCVCVRACVCVCVTVRFDRSSYKTIVASIAGLLKAQMHSVNTTLQSVPDYNVSLASEPCAHYPTSCRSGSLPPPPPPAPPAPPNPDHRKPICNSRCVRARASTCHVSLSHSFSSYQSYASSRRTVHATFLFLTPFSHTKAMRPRGEQCVVCRCEPVHQAGSSPALQQASADTRLASHFEPLQ